MSNKIFKGALLLTSAAFISKFLGMIYIIPFNEIVGPEGIVLYSYAYVPYTILLSVSMIGIPAAVSKIVSRYNSLGFPDVGLRVFKVSLLSMLMTGIIGFIILFFGAKEIAVHIDSPGHSLEDVAQVIKMVSFALLIIPAMSVFRGYFQGNQYMKPTAVSEVVEQVVRITFLLISVYIVINIVDGSIATAVSYATFAAFIGGISAFIVLAIFWRKFMPNHSSKNTVHQSYIAQQSNKELLKELVSYAGPFVLVGIVIPLYQSVDQFTFNHAMIFAGLEDISELALGAINVNGHKLISIPITIALGLSAAIIPALTESFTKNKYQKLDHEINQSLQIVLLFILPAVFGLSVLGNEAYGALFGMYEIDVTGRILSWYAPTALLFGLYTVTGSILQGINEQRFTVVSLVVGFVIKLLLNSVMIHRFGEIGSIIATDFALIVAVGLNIVKIYRTIQFNYMQTLRRLLFMVIFSIIMSFAVIFTKYIAHFIIDFDTSRFAAIIMLIVGAAVGAVVYLWLIYSSTLLEFVLGDLNILNRFRRNKNASR